MSPILSEIHDLDHCPHCDRLLPFFDRSVAHQRGAPQACWTCQRQQVSPKEALHRRVARQPTVIHLPRSTDPVPA